MFYSSTIGQSHSHCHDFDWRYTFSSAEADLFHYHRDKKALKLAYIVLKLVIKLYKSPVANSGLIKVSGMITQQYCYYSNLVLTITI